MPPKTKTEETQDKRPTRVRTSHACDRCRESRARCSGGVRCIKCTKDDAQCQYSDRKREHNKKNAQQIDSLQDDKQELIAALRDLIERPDFRPDKQPELLGLLDKMSTDTLTASSKSGTGTQVQSQSRISRLYETSKTEDQKEGISDTSPWGESIVRSDIGSPDRQRELASVVDLDDGTGMTGYVGKMSGMSWLQRVREYLVGIAPKGSLDFSSTLVDVHAINATSLTYFMDDQDLLAVDEDYVQPHQLPPWQLALVLSEAYFHSLQGSFCFVERKNFYAELTATYEMAASGRYPSWDKRKYLAMSNMMWSVGAKWLELTNLDQRPVSHLSTSPILDSHLTYYARARALGLDHRIQLDHPSILLVQGMGILAFYLMVNGSIQRSWSLVGQAVRHATALGLHLRVSSETLSNLELRYRARVWYSLFRLEILLSEITGRPKCLRGSDVTLPLTSLVLEEEEAQAEHPVLFNYPTEGTDPVAVWATFIGMDQGVTNTVSGGSTPSKHLRYADTRSSETQFLAALELSVISDVIGSKIYLSPADLTWADVQSTAQELESELSRWQARLSPHLKLENTGEASIDPRSILEVEMYYCSVKMILYRPFLCEILIDDESQDSTEFNQLCARRCVHAAIQVINMLPDQLVAEQILQALPWWGLLHFVCQAAAILLLEMCLNIQHMQKETRDIMAAMKKALNYFWALSPGSKSAYKAWAMFRLLVEKVTQRYSYGLLVGLPQEVQKPQGWSDEDHRMLQQSLAKILQ